MKKILSGFILLTLLFALVLPLGISAQITEVPNFCILKHDVKMKDGVAIKGSIIGETTCTLTAGAGNLCCHPKTAAECKVAPGTGDEGRDDWGLICIIDKVYNAIDWIFWILIAITGILVLVGAFYYAFAAGDPKKSTQGKQIIIAALVSLVVAMFARFIPSVVMGILL